MFRYDEFFLAIGVGACICFFFLSLVAIYIYSVPIVVFDYKTGLCHEVLFGDDIYSCENLPDRYETDFIYIDTP